MKVWLDTRGIRYPEGSKKVELFQLTKINKPTFQLFSKTAFWQDMGMLHFVCTPLPRAKSH
jgi:hypothetical protein